MKPATPAALAKGGSAVNDPSRRCTATSKSTGEQCKRWAYPGAKVCVNHGGAAPAVKAAADRRILTRKLEEDASAVLAHHGVDVISDPLEELGKLAAETRAMANALGQRVNALNDIETWDDKSAPHARVALEAYERSLDRTHRLLDSLVKHGYTERQVKLQEDQAMLVAGVLRRTIASLGLTADQQKAASVALAEEFRAIGTLL